MRPHLEETIKKFNEKMTEASINARTDLFLSMQLNHKQMNEEESCFTVLCIDWDAAHAEAENIFRIRYKFSLNEISVATNMVVAN